MRYLPKSPSERQEMLASLRLGSVEGLFEYLPDELRLKRSLNIPPGKSEYEIIDYFRQRAEENAAGYASFLGAGVYRHYRPVVIDSLATRGEFLTAYTPYQAEISQGVLTTIFEFQTMVCQLTGMEVANASMYDGSTAVPEAAMMASRITARDKILVARSLHPEYREVVRTYHRYQDSSIQEVAYDRETGQIDLADLERKLTPEVAAVIVQSPNFFGCIERTREASKLAHKHGALLVVVFTEAVSLGLLQPPLEADIVAGELQSFAHPSSYGGPFVGVLATKEKYIRQIPGRLVGETVDSNGNRAFCLTLATREQHIRRAKATSNICTNQALVALMATIFMSIYGRRGLRELAEQNLAKAHYLATQLKKRGATLPFRAPFFNEFVMQPNGSTASEINRRALERKVIGGLELGRFYPELEGSMVLCTTEVNRQTEMDSFVEACSEQH